MWEMSWRRGHTVILTQSSSRDHSSTSSSSWQGCSSVGHWGPKALRFPLALNSATFPQLTQTVCALVTWLFHIYLLPLFFRLFTLAHLLIDGLVEGQSITFLILFIRHCYLFLSSFMRMFDHSLFRRYSFEYGIYLTDKSAVNPLLVSVF